MTLTLEATPVPLRLDEDGVYRVGESRVVLDIVVREFERGSSPAEITADYSTLTLSEVYAVVAHYLRHRDEVDQYIRDRAERAEDLRRDIEASQEDRGDQRAILLARQASRKRDHAAPTDR